MFRRRPAPIALLAALALIASCRKPAPPPPPPPPTVAATVLVYETAVIHESRSFRWQVLTDGVRVRFGDEAERWRLFDMQARTIALIDQTNRSWRRISFDEAIAQRRSLLDTPLPEGAPRALVTEQPAGSVAGRDAVRVVVEAGGYRRTLVLSTAPLLPASAWTLKWATDPLDAEYSGMLRELLPALIAQQGTLLADRNELVYEGGAMATETRLVSVHDSRLPKSLFEVPAGFRTERTQQP